MPVHRARVALSCLGLIAAVATAAGAQPYFEDFTTTTFEDTGATTADWNTATGELRMFPFQPSVRGTFDAVGIARSVFVAGHRAYLAASEAGLDILDITTLGAPTLLASFNTPGTAIGVVVDGDLAFVADGTSGLQILDVGNPALPTLVGSFDTPGNAQDVAVRGNLAYVADGASGLVVIDIRNPAAPSLKGGVDTPGGAQDLAVAGRHAFVADTAGGLQVIDVGNPAAPVVVGALAMPDLAQDVAVDGDLLYLAIRGAGLALVDVSVPSDPKLLGQVDTPGLAVTVAASGDLVAVGDFNLGLRFVDVSNPAAPVIESSLLPGGNVDGLFLAGDQAFVAAGLAGLHVVDLRLPASPVPRSFLADSLVWDVFVAGDHAYVARLNGLRILDVSDPATPVPIAFHATTDIVHEVMVTGDLAFLAVGSSGLVVLDVTNPSSPIALGALDTPTTCSSVAVAGQHAFVTDTSAGLIVVDVSDPSNPTQAGILDTPGLAADIHVAGNHAFVADFDFGLKVIDVSNPAAPSLVTTVPIPGVATDVFASGPLLFVIGQLTGPCIFDISEPTSPVLVGEGTVGATHDGFVYGRRLFLPDQNGLHILDVGDPTTPTQIGFYFMVNPTQVFVTGGLAFVVREGFGLQVLDVSQSDVDPVFDTGQSLNVDASTDLIVRALLTGNYTAGVSWELSNNGGSTWQTLNPPGLWLRFPTAGSNLRWRSTHTWAGGNPTVSDLTLDWLGESSSIQTISDVPNDQGGRVYVQFRRSGYDFAGESSAPVTQYGVYRRIEDIVKASSGWAESSSLPGAREAWIDGILHVTGAPFPPGTWVLVNSVPATQSDSYLVEATTVADDPSTFDFVVTTHTVTPTYWFVSAPVTGASIDNIAPGVPSNLTADYQSSAVTLDWSDATESDFQFHRIYRDLDPDFVPGPTHLVDEVAISTYVHATTDPWSFTYKVTTLDHAGNESPPASPQTVTSAPVTARRHQLGGATPNPFNPSTTLSYELATPGIVSIRVYDLAGRQVKTLLEGLRPAGAEHVTWQGRDDDGRPVASGVYLIRMEAGTFSSTRRVTMVK